MTYFSDNFGILESVLTFFLRCKDISLPVFFRCFLYIGYILCRPKYIVLSYPFDVFTSFRNTKEHISIIGS